MGADYAARLQTLRDARYSLFHTTPLAVLSHCGRFVLQKNGGCQCQQSAWANTAVAFLYFSPRVQTLQLSFIVVRFYALLIAGFANLSKNDWQFVRPPREQVDTITQHLYVTHGSIVVSLAGPRYADLDWGFYWRLVDSLIAIPIVAVSAVLLGVLLVACYEWHKRLLEGLEHPKTFGEFCHNQLVLWHRTRAQGEIFQRALERRGDDFFRIINGGGDHAVAPPETAHGEARDHREGGDDDDDGWETMDDENDSSANENDNLDDSNASGHDGGLGARVFKLKVD